MESLKIIVENTINEGKRTILVFNSSNGEHSFIPEPGENTTTARTEFYIAGALDNNNENYLLIAPAPGSGECTGFCLIYVPFNSDYYANITFSRIQDYRLVQSSTGTFIIIPHSRRLWQLKVAADQKSQDGDEPEFTVNLMSSDDDPPDSSGGGIGPLASMKCDNSVSDISELFSKGL